MKLSISLYILVGMIGGFAAAETQLPADSRSLILTCTYGEASRLRAEVHRISSESLDTYQLKLCVSGVCGWETVTPKKDAASISFGAQLTVTAETAARDLRCQHKQRYWYVQKALNSPCGCAANDMALDEI